LSASFVITRCRNVENSPVIYSGFLTDYSGFLTDFSALVWRFLNIVAKKLTELFGQFGQFVPHCWQMGEK
jgi:hypothetical protein